MKKTLLALLAIILPGFLAAMDFVPALDINGGITYPTMVTGDSAELDKRFGLDAGLAGSFMVNTDILPQLWFVPTLTLNYSTTAQPLSVDDQRFMFSKWLDAYLSAGFNYQFDENWELRLRGLLRADLTAQTADETLANGLYNYWDKGFYLENSSKFGTDVTAEITAGFKYLDKRFPNYESLTATADTIGGTLNAEAKKEKDTLTYSGYISCDMQLGNSGWFPAFSFNFDYMPYLEQRRINPDGTLSGSLRIDRFFVLELAFPYYASDVTGANLGYTLNIKNTSQNYYDSMETTDPGDDVYTVNYYNYINHVFNFVYTYEFESAFLNSYKPSLSIGLNVDILAYTDRYAKDIDGAYTAKKELDFNYKLFLDYRHKLADFWSYYVNLTFTRFTSNMKWEAYGTFNYSLVTLTLGTALSF